MKDLNLLPDYIVSINQRKDRDKGIIIAGAFVVVIVIGIVVAPTIQLFMLNKTKDELSVKAQKYVDAVNQAAFYEGIKDSIDAKENLIAAISKTEGFKLQLFRKIEAVAPKLITLSTFDIDEGSKTIKVTGLARDEIAVTDFLFELRNDPFFEDANMDGGITKQFILGSKDYVVPFSFNIIYK